ncbi:hypothetical protein Bbelb_010720 [Branchiostoma belcheri]|nr:hypothetical protein Bbelb_010720 [Branchiostoma belcheri]
MAITSDRRWNNMSEHTGEGQKPIQTGDFFSKRDTFSTVALLGCERTYRMLSALCDGLPAASHAYRGTGRAGETIGMRPRRQAQPQLTQQHSDIVASPNREGRLE